MTFENDSNRNLKAWGPWQNIGKMMRPEFTWQRFKNDHVQVKEVQNPSKFK
jgi:hypothetical protein